MIEYKVVSAKEAYEAGVHEWYEYGDVSDRDYQNCIVIMEDGKITELLGSDGGEPEDQTLHRDWAWVAEALNVAYLKGFGDGYEKK